MGTGKPRTAPTTVAARKLSARMDTLATTEALWATRDALRDEIGAAKTELMDHIGAMATHIATVVRDALAEDLERHSKANAESLRVEIGVVDDKATHALSQAERATADLEAHVADDARHR